MSSWSVGARCLNTWTRSAMNLSSFHCLIVLIMIGLYHHLTFAQQTVITVPPQSVNVSLNGVAQFNCSGIGSLLIWNRDGTDLANGNDGISITPATIDASQDLLMSSLSIPVSSTNASNITCIAGRTSPVSKNESDPALLLVQGLLESVSDLTVSRINSTTVLISWSPPFTLEGVPILSYNVTITTSGENDTVPVAGGTTMLYYSIQNSFIVTVVPINSVGPGDKDSLLHTVSSTTSQDVVPSSSTVVSAVSPTLPPTSAPSLSSNQLAGIIVGVLVGLGLILAAFILTLVLALYYRVCRRKAKQSQTLSRNLIVTTKNEAYHKEGTLSQPNFEEDRDNSESKPRASILAGKDVPDSREPFKAQKLTVDESLKEVLNNFEADNLVILHENFKLVTKIGNGFFGNVFEAKVKNNSKKIIAKTCKSTNTDAMKCQFLYEADILRHYTHPNIVLLIGVVANELDPLSIVMEDVGCTFLFFLKSENGQECSKNVLTEMCKQVCEGMEYLERNNCVHRGLTAKNCLVNEHDNIVKISKFGMSLGKIHLDPSDPKLRPAPIKWTAPEALKHGRFSSASDVWSFGVLLWETFSLGKEPYGKTHEKKVAEKVKRGDRMLAPKKCPPPVFDIMLECWEYDPKNRPTFAELLTELCKLIPKEDSEASDHEQ